MTKHADIHRRSVLASLGLSALAATGATAQGFPSQNIVLMVPFAAGGPSDAIARLIGQSMARTLGQQVLIENVVGAGGTAAATRLSKSQPDGYTMLIHHIALMAGAFLYKNLPYDTLGFETIGLVNYGPMILATRKDYPAATPAELFARLKADGNKTTLANGGIGSNAHLCGLLLQKALGVKLTEVAYRGTGPAMNDLVSGQIDMLFDQSTNAVPQVEAGTIKAFAVTSSERLEALPNVPTVKEIGLEGVEFTLWHGLYAPKGTPKAIVDQINGALGVALQDSLVRERFAAFGTKLFPQNEWTPAAHRAKLEREFALWRSVLG